MRGNFCAVLLTASLTACTSPAPPPSAGAAPSASIRTARRDVLDRVTPWVPSGFHLKGKDLPHDFQGTNASAFGELFSQISRKAAKGTYETTAEHRARIRDLKAALDPIDPGQSYAFVIPDVLFSYDADRAAFVPMTGSCGSADTWATTNHPDAACKVAASITQYDPAAPRFTTIGVYYALVIPLRTARKFLSDGSWRAICPAPRDHARALAGFTVEYALVGRVTGAEEVPVPDDTLKPGTFFSGHGIPFAPSKLICFVRETGEVLSVSSFRT